MSNASTEAADRPAVRRITRTPSVEEQAALQELSCPEGSTLLRYRDVVRISGALGVLANKHLPNKNARIHVARCIRELKPFVAEFNDEKQRITNEHLPKVDSAEDGDSISIRDPLGMQREHWELELMVVAVRLPNPITDSMLPANDKAHTNNEDGLSAILADLDPLYAIEATSEASS